MGAALRPWTNHRPAGRHARLGPAREPCRGLRAAQGIANNRTVHVYSARRAPKLGAFWCRFCFPLSPRLRGSRSAAAQAASGPGRDGRLHAPRSSAPGLLGAGEALGEPHRPPGAATSHTGTPRPAHGAPTLTPAQQLRPRHRSPEAPAPLCPPLPLSARLPLSRLVTGVAGQPPSSRPASPPSDWTSRSERSTNPDARCSLRQRQQLRQLGSAPPVSRACSAAAAPWRRASRGTRHSPPSPQNRGHLCEKRAEKAAGEATGSR